MDLLFEGLPEELPEKFLQLIILRVKIEKWWVFNIEIPTHPDFDVNRNQKYSENGNPTTVKTGTIIQ